mmetsp:Transcript_52090/g.124037  ORF Transcript_52090/g.124037 Transcript_52090/m.124037 type:complete len:255 (+) Transcript_52090:1023-1787(+)
MASSSFSSLSPSGFSSSLPLTAMYRSTISEIARKPAPNNCITSHLLWLLRELKDSLPSSSGKIPLMANRVACVMLKESIRPMTSSSHSSQDSSHSFSHSSSSPSSPIATLYRIVSAILCSNRMPIADSGTTQKALSALALKKGNCCTAPQALIEAKPVMCARTTAKHFKFSSTSDFFFGVSPTAPLIHAKLHWRTVNQKSMWTMSIIACFSRLKPSLMLASTKSFADWKSSTAQKIETVPLITSYVYLRMSSSG